MTLLQLTGAMFIAYGPAFALFVFTIAKDPLRIIVMMAGMFFWLLSLLLSSIWWTAVVPLKDQLAFGVTFSVIFQEVGRFFYYKLLRKAEDGLQQFDTRAPQPQGRTQIDNTSHTSATEGTRHGYAYVAGLGFGMMSALFSFVNVLADAKGPGTVGIHEDPGHPLQAFLLTSAFLTMCFSLLHIVWNILFFYGFENRDYKAVVLVVATHFLISLLSLLDTQYLYHITLPISYAILLVLSVISFFVVGGSISNIKAALSCKNERSYDL
ncbi:gamma-secretase subunit Aph-1-like [Amphiura filiformis]|uniref:gamma-secretase subunit Aph-1-like n=1 Tax=Amphiura filiformis TaxID=82378 RepID=UPI003B21F658